MIQIIAKVWSQNAFPLQKKAIRNQQKRKHDYADINTFFVKGKELQYCLQSVIQLYCISAMAPNHTFWQQTVLKLQKHSGKCVPFHVLKADDHVLAAGSIFL